MDEAEDVVDENEMNDVDGRIRRRKKKKAMVDGKSVIEINTVEQKRGVIQKHSKVIELVSENWELIGSSSEQQIIFSFGKVVKISDVQIEKKEYFFKIFHRI